MEELLRGIVWFLFGFLIGWFIIAPMIEHLFNKYKTWKRK